MCNQRILVMSLYTSSQYYNENTNKHTGNISTANNVLQYHSAGTNPGYSRTGH